MNFNIREIIYALSDALGYVGMDDMLHGRRVGYMAHQLSQVLGQPELVPGFMFDLGILHDIGVSSTQSFKQLVSEFESENENLHCEVGYQRLLKFKPLADMALPVRYHHTHWEVLKTLDLPEAIRAQANLIYLADRVDALTRGHGHQDILSIAESVRQIISERRHRYFRTDFVDAFLTVSCHEAFWLGLDPRNLQRLENRLLTASTPLMMDMTDLKQLAQIFADVVDAKSSFTAEHSAGVARLAVYLAESMALDPETVQQIEIAGLLHDIGKLRVPDEILDKPGPLSHEERNIMKVHSYETYMILQQIHGLEHITQWATLHHEEPDASGYPFGHHAMDTPLEARILRVADIVQALVQDRPYRAGMNEPQLREVLEDLLAKGKLDSSITQQVLQNLPAAMAVARARTA
ncbi:MAG: hypothetical protein RIQ52_1925 [Pseudomonadota bacterium]|jgi:putative nucleotidyltransferase with HDIG domain